MNPLKVGAPVPRTWGPGMAATPEGTLSYTYYPTGKVETIQSSNAHRVSAAYTWDDQNRLDTVVDNNLPGQNTTTYTYDNASNVATVKIPNGLTSTFTYDALNRLTELSTPPIADYRYTLGLTGIRTSATEQSGRALQWSYDNIYRVPTDRSSSVGWSTVSPAKPSRATRPTTAATTAAPRISSIRWATARRPPPR